jgi:Asp-tRNA(Asn)/Glu-tRNA(Gln) amidotransferase A subunit family amidase
VKKADGILLAKTNLPEFSYSTESDNLLTGRTSNPWNLDRTSGGSSGGESAAIAAGLSPFGLGTDLAISMRFGTTADGLPNGVQLAATWYAESTVLYLAGLLESVSAVRGQHPDL